MDIYPPPDLAIEIAKSSLSDDLGNKRMLYERLGVAEYWVAKVQRAQLVGFAIANGGSRQIAQSQVLPPLPFTLLEEALQRSRTPGRSQLYNWLIAQMQALGDSRSDRSPRTILMLKYNRAKEMHKMSREFNLIIERDSECYFVTSVPSLRGCHTHEPNLSTN